MVISGKVPIGLSPFECRYSEKHKTVPSSYYIIKEPGCIQEYFPNLPHKHTLPPLAPFQ